MFFPDRNTERMMEMWADLLSQIENEERGEQFNRSQKRIGNIEVKDTEIVLSADLPGVEKKDIELSVHTDSISFKATTKDRNYDFGQSFDFELKPSGVKATFVNGVLDVVVQKSVETQGKIIKIE